MSVKPPTTKNKTFSQFYQDYLEYYGYESNLPYAGPKFDAHTHLRAVSSVKKSMMYSKEFQIQRILGIVNKNINSKLDKRYPNMFTCARFFFGHPYFFKDPKKITSKVDDMHSKGYKVVKFWFAPIWKKYIRARNRVKWKISSLADDFFAPLFSRIEEKRMRLLIHVSDPDLWYKEKYQPESFYGTKLEHLNDLEIVLKRYPKLLIQGAHFGAQPEHLNNLARMLNRYPNFYVDISSARWMARELSKNLEETKKFFEKFRTRLFFGTDLTFGKFNQERNKEYFYTRYLTYLALFETNVRGLPLPFKDPENKNATQINGLNLPKEVLKSIYWDNANLFYSFDNN